MGIRLLATLGRLEAFLCLNTGGFHSASDGDLTFDNIPASLASLARLELLAVSPEKVPAEAKVVRRLALRLSSCAVT